MSDSPSHSESINRIGEQGMHHEVPGEFPHRETGVIRFLRSIREALIRILPSSDQETDVDTLSYRTSLKCDSIGSDETYFPFVYETVDPIVEWRRDQCDFKSERFSGSSSAATCIPVKDTESENIAKGSLEERTTDLDKKNEQHISIVTTGSKKLFFRC